MDMQKIGPRAISLSIAIVLQGAKVPIMRELTALVSSQAEVHEVHKHWQQEAGTFLGPGTNNI